ncbi:MAG: ATP-binding cassette domain-containing protein [Geminicoccaceae bacterium]|nr:ATP-binding cassette domain-containing protein [Geminicoccaceae bacterium]MCS7267488.1 ATP-binding cassette domain-containing protein [Geminicoccaceae bacterium]MCX7629170.1 ATP-binding cassette domain-containing protein [Geminicoccaceae bacterium]MDW8123692.1 ATP-binding cassette domain-containing protein [Geminicoccaceae bacterium]MDW8342029.1 ATP-binding cassette domain-containing protein [Geminicoccaceae bacterium]
MVRLERLTKRFGDVRAVEEVSFSVGRGEVLGFLGPNGAGKSTTMRMLTGYLLPTSGTAKVMGFDVVERAREVKKRIGYLPEGAPLYADMSPLALLRFVGGMRGLEGKELERKIARAIELTSLEEVAHRPIDTLSKGFRRRVGLAQAILHDPPVLVLDEPTDGLDPNQKHEVRKLIKAMSAEKAIIVSTHILEEVDAVCDRAVIIARGRIVADATPEELERRAPNHNAVRVTIDRERAEEAATALRTLNTVREVRRVEEVDGVATLLVLPTNGADIGATVSQLLHARGIRVERFAVERGRLDEVFRALTANAAT